MLKGICIWWMAVSAPALAEDPDLTRPVPEGEVRYTGERLASGATAHAYLIRYEGHSTWYVSPSRYEVDFGESTFHFRNADAHPLPVLGQWLDVVFNVGTVSETAMESPEGSNNWTWKLTYECELVKIIPAT